MSEIPAFDVRAWAVWLLAAAALTMLTRNPFYLVILLLVAVAVETTCRLPGSGLRLSLWRLGLVIIAFSTLINALTIHVGATVLFSLPAGWPLIGGPITLEAAVYGALNGLMLVTLLALFMAFNASVPVSDLARFTPRALHDMGLVLLIALTYVPETTRQLQRIREAQAIRGHRVRTLRDWRPITIPLLVGGLERAMRLAETMVARGFGATATSAQTTWARVGLLLGLAATFGGWVLSFWARWPGWALMAGGVGLIGVLFWRLGRQVAQTRYRPRAWTRWDSLLVATAVLPLLLITLPWPFIASETLAYTPYPQLTLPPFDPLIGLALAALALPAIAAARLVQSQTANW